MSGKIVFYRLQGESYVCRICLKMSSDLRYTEAVVPWQTHKYISLFILLSKFPLAKSNRKSKSRELGVVEGKVEGKREQTENGRHTVISCGNLSASTTHAI